MGLRCGAQCAKIILIIFNFIFWLSGATLMVIGIWFRVDKSLISMVVLIQKPDEPVIDIITYILIGVGALIFVVGFFGCCGALKESRCLLCLYIFLMVLVMGGELAGGVWAAIFKADLEPSGQMLTYVKQKYKDDIPIRRAIDVAQTKLKCCGVSGPSDWKDSTAYMNDSTKSVPASCCEGSGNADTWKVNDEAKCQQDAESLFSDQTFKTTALKASGCLNAVKTLFSNNIIVVIVVGCSIAGLEIFGFLFALCLCRAIDKDVD